MIRLKRKNIVRLVLTFEFFLTCVFVIGCEEQVQQNSVKESKINTKLIYKMNDIAIENAIISQHTLYPYHFFNNSEKLNELGQRDLSVLANHYKDNPGLLNIRRDGAAEELYQARVTHVIENLRELGVMRIEISDGMPGGPGISSERVMKILEDKQKPGAESADGITVESRKTGSDY